METVFLEWLQTPSMGKVFVSFLLLIALSFFPFMPIAVVYGVIALALPLWLALLINIGGSVIGAILMFVLCKSLLRNYYEQKLRYLNQTSTFIRVLKKNHFTAIFVARLVPFLPTALINVLCAMFQIPLKTYALATLLGKLPAIIIYSMVGNQLLEGNYLVYGIGIVYLVILLFLSRKLKKSWSIEKPS